MTEPAPPGFERHAPSPPAVVLDVGGAAGAYAFWLAELGYEVRLIDATPRLVDIARARNETATHRLASCRVDLRREVAEAGFHVEGMFGIEGPGWILSDVAERCADPARREMLLHVARGLESDDSVIGCSAHLMAVGRKH